MVRQIASDLFSHVRVSSCPDVIAFATVDWHTVSDDPLFQYFDSLFRSQIDQETLQLYNVEDAFHPFAFAAKVQSNDFPTYHEILRMSGEERRKWIESMDVEMSDLMERNAFELVP